MIRRCSIDAKAKINLGLEVLGKRSDGFHDICSILAMIDLTETLDFTYSPGNRGRVSISSVGFDIDPEDNLITAAISAFNVAAETKCFPQVSLTKAIPVAAGLGGASSDCAATLLAMNHLTGNPLTRLQLVSLAANLGSDIPFFLGSPVGYVTGRGTDIQPLPSIIETPVVVVTPNISIAFKTPTLYKELRPEEWTNGSKVRKQVERLQSGQGIDPTLLGNAFESALNRISPRSVAFQEALLKFGTSSSWLSGAGPSRYLFPTTDEDPGVVSQIRNNSNIDAYSQFAVRFSHSGLEIAE